MLNQKKIEQATALLLEGLGVDSTDHNFINTPARVARVYAEMFDPPELDIPVFDEHYNDLVMIRGHEFYTMCPHHLLPVRIVASIAYIPSGKVIGASKLMRMIHDINRQPMTQERLTREVAESVCHHTNGGSKGVAVFMRGEHGCFRIRGVRAHDADMVTTTFLGCFDLSQEMQDNFLRLAGAGAR